MVALFVSTMVIVCSVGVDQLASATVLGARPAATVPLFNVWTYQHSAEAVSRSEVAYWDAPIFFPSRGTFAMSDPQPLTALAYHQLASVAPPVVAFNVLLLLTLTFNGVACGWLLSILGVETGPRLFGVVAACWLPFCVEEIGVTQMVMLFPVFSAIGWLVTYHRQPSLLAAIGLGTSVAVSYLTSGYWGLWLGLGVAISAVAMCRRRHFGSALLGHIAAASALVLVSCGWLIAGQLAAIGEYHWETDYIASLSATPIDYFRVRTDSLAASVPTSIAAGDWPVRLYPGIGIILLAVFGAITGWRNERRGTVLFCLAAIQFAFLLSLGRIEPLGDWSPMPLLQTTLPGFDKLRSPYRLGLFVQLALVVLAALGVSAGVGRLGGVGKFSRVRVATWFVVCLAILEINPIWPAISSAQLHPETLAAVASSDENEFEPGWCRWLRGQPPGAVAHLPFETTEIGHLETVRLMHWQRRHEHPLVNGYSGFAPPRVLVLAELCKQFPTRAAITALFESQARYLVLSKAETSDELFDQLKAFENTLELAYEDADVVALRFPDHIYLQGQKIMNESQRQP